MLIHKTAVDALRFQSYVKVGGKQNQLTLLRSLCFFFELDNNFRKSEIYKMYKQDLKNLRIVVENILESNLGKQFLCENEIYQNFSMDKYLKLNQRSSRFGRTLKRKLYDNMVYSEKQLKTIEDDEKQHPILSN